MLPTLSHALAVLALRNMKADRQGVWG